MRGGGGSPGRQEDSDCLNILRFSTLEEMCAPGMFLSRIRTCTCRVCSFLVPATHWELDLYYVPATQLRVAGSFGVNKDSIKMWRRATAANGSVINSASAKNTHPVVAACVKYRIKWLITASFSDVIMENSLTCEAKWWVQSLSSSIQIIFNKTI